MNYSKSKQDEINPNDRYVYYDMVLSNIDSQNTDNVQQLVFTDRRTQPIINNMSQYKFSVVRFSISTWTLPVLYFQTNTYSNDALEGIYGITMDYYNNNNGTTISSGMERIFFEPQDLSKTKPAPPNTFKYGISEFNDYYYIFNFNNMISMINTTFAFVFSKLQDAVGGAIDTAKPPIMVWNDDLTATLYCEQDFYDVTSQEYIKIYFNRPLYSLFNSFPSYKFKPEADGKHYEILCDSRQGINCTTIPEYSPSVLIKVKQEYACQESWSPIDSIVFSTSMPIVSTILSSPCLYQNGYQLQLSNTYNNTLNIISDFQSSENNYRSTLYYTPSGGDFRWVSFAQSDLPLYTIDVRVHIKDRYGIIRDFYLPSNSKASMKILFQKLD